MKVQAPLRYLFLVSGPNQVNILRPVAEQLQLNNSSVHFLSLDPYYNQGATPELQQSSFTWSELPLLGSAEHWWDYTEEERLPFLEQAERSLREFYRDFDPHVLLLANDRGDLEQLCLRLAEVFGVRTARLQDGIQHMPKRKENMRVISADMCDTGAELQLVWSESVARNLRMRNTAANVVVTGNPRYDAIAQRDEADSSAGVKILLGTQCFSEYKIMSADEEISLYRSIIEKLLQRADTEVEIKTHPSSRIVDRYRELCRSYQGRVSICEVPDSLEAISQAQAVLAVNSTIVLDAISLGVPARFLAHEYNRDASEQYHQADEVFQRQIRAENFPQSLLETEDELPKTLIAENAQNDGQAALRVCRELEKLTELPATSSSEQGDGISILVEFAELHSLASLRSLLRQRKCEFEIIAIDTSVAGYQDRLPKDLSGDPRLRVLHHPGISKPQARHIALQHCSNEIILCFDFRCIAFPTMLSSLREYMQQDADCRLLLPACALPNTFGITSQIAIPPKSKRYDVFLQDKLAGLFANAYAFRANPQAMANEVTRGDTSADLQIIAALNRSSVEGIATLERALYLAPGSTLRDDSLHTSAATRTENARNTIFIVEQSFQDLQELLTSEEASESIIIDRSVTAWSDSEREEWARRFSGIYAHAAGFSPDSAQELAQRICRSKHSRIRHLLKPAKTEPSQLNRES